MKTAKYRAWITEAGWEAKRQFSGPAIERAEVSIEVPENGRRDLGNYEKPLVDLLVSLRVIKGDRCKQLRHISLDWWEGDDCRVMVSEAA